MTMIDRGLDEGKMKGLWIPILAPFQSRNRDTFSYSEG